MKCPYHNAEAVSMGVINRIDKTELFRCSEKGCVFSEAEAKEKEAV